MPDDDMKDELGEEIEPKKIPLEGDLDVEGVDEEDEEENEEDEDDAI